MTSPLASAMPDTIERLFEQQRTGDVLGLRIHQWAAMLACFLAGWPTSYVEWAAAPVLCVCLVRFTNRVNLRVPGPLLKDRGVQALLALVAWMVLSLAWTAGTLRDWTNDIQSLRFAVLVMVLYPAMQRRTTLILAVTLGMAAGQFVQMLDVIGHVLGIAWLDWARAPGRHSGWWDPVVGGSVLCAGLGLHVAAASTGRGKERLLGVLGTLLTLVSIGLTGTRGAWIGAGVVIGAGCVLGVWRWQTGVRSGHVLPVRGQRGRSILVLGVAGIIAAGVLGLAATRLGLVERFQQGVREVRGVAERKDYATDTGLRIAMAQWAVMEVQDHPLIGVGAGGYRAWADRAIAHAGGEALGQVPPRPHAHAHSWALHTLATLGVIGGVLMALLVVLSIRHGLRWRGGRGVRASAYEAGPALALVGLIGAGLFDTIHVNQQTAYVLYLCIALCVSVRPAGFAQSYEHHQRALCASTGQASSEEPTTRQSGPCSRTGLADDGVDSPTAQASRVPGAPS